MRFSLAAISASALVVICAAAFAVGDSADEPREDLRERVAEAVRRLGSDSFPERKEAGRTLLEWGPEILPLLPDPALLDDASVREGVRSVRAALQEQKARESARASRVTLHGEHSLAELFDSLEKQTGNSLDRSKISAESAQRRYAIEFEKTPFWTALRTLAEKAGLRIVEEHAKRAIRLVPADDAQRPAPAAVDLSGPFRIVVDSVTIRPLFGDARRRLLRVRFDFLAEPRLRPLFLDLKVEDVVARLPGKAPLRHFSPEAHHELPLAEGRTSFAVDYVIRAETHPEAVAIEGRMTVKMATGREALRFPPLPEMAGASRRRGGVTVTAGDIEIDRHADDTFSTTLPLTVSYDAGGPVFESHRQWVYHNEIHLESNAGERVPLAGGFRVTRQTDGGAALEYVFEKIPGDPSDFRFVYVLPTLILDAPVEFDFPRVPVTPATETATQSTEKESRP